MNDYLLPFSNQAVSSVNLKSRSKVSTPWGFPFLFWAKKKLSSSIRPVLIENRHLCSGFSEQGCSRKSPPGTGAVQTVVDLLSYRMFVLMRTFMAFWILWPQKHKYFVDVSKRPSRVGSSQIEWGSICFDG